MTGNRVDTGKFGIGVMSGEYESIGAAGEFIRYEVILDVPEKWACHASTTRGPFFQLKELTFI